jgi:arylsulfatase A-like enzyme
VLDAIAADAAVFEQAFAHACSTRPSFPSILTSSYPLMYGGYESISPERTLISEVFDAAGYRTGGFHSNAYLNPEFGYGRGFDTYFDSMADTSFLARLRQFVKNNLDKEGVVYRTLASAFDTAERQAGANIGSAYVDADELTDRAIAWLRDGQADDEFLWVHYMDVHHPYLPPARHQRAFRDEPISERRAIQLRRKFIEDPEDVTDAERADIIDLYDAEIRFTDAEIGRLLDVVDEQWDEYTVAITADHGEEFTDHGEFSHYAKFYDEVLHIPLVYQAPGATGRYDELVGLLDVAPTLVEDAGLTVPDNYYGHSLRRLLDGDEWPRTQVLGDWASNPGEGDRRFACRTRDWKYIRRSEGEELYDLQADPGEQENRIDAAPAVLAELRQAVDDHEAAIEETMVDVETVEMDDEVKARLRDLGYKE